MTDLIVAQNNLPATLDDLSKFVLVGDEKIKADRAEISALKKLGVAQEVVKIKLHDAQITAEQVTFAKIKLGELINALPKQQGARTDLQPVDMPVEKLKPKSEAVAELGISQKQAERLQQMAKNPDVVQAAMAKARENGDVISQAQIMNEIKNNRKKISAIERAERKSYTPPSEISFDACKLICADIRSGLPEITDNSVDFIITDPPYPKEFLPLYGYLSNLAARVLKNGGSLICMTGQSYLPEVIQLLATKMRYHWILCYLTPGGQSPQLFQKKVNTFWKPLLWFVKGNYNGDWVGDVLKSPVNDNDKRFHEWGQSFGGMKDIIERMTNPDDVILDPFLGGGTTGLAALSCKRKFIGIDIKQENIDVTKTRLSEAFPNA